MFRRPRSIKLMTIAGIRIGVDGTWFSMLFLLIFLLAGSFRDALHSSDDVAYLTTVVTVLLFFGSLIVHELGHALAARREGIHVQRIELFLFGGTTYMGRDSQTPGEEFRIAAAGRSARCCSSLLCLAIDLALVGPHRLLHAIELDGTVQHHAGTAGAQLAVADEHPDLRLQHRARLPAGRRADCARRDLAGHGRQASRHARRCPHRRRLCGPARCLRPLHHASDPSFVGGDPGFAGIWLLLLAFMIWQSARMALNGTAAASRVQGVRVADIMDHEPVVVRGTSTVEQALDESFLRYQTEWLPVVDGDGRFIGIARRERAQELVDAGHGDATVGSILEPGDTASSRSARADR